MALGPRAAHGLCCISRPKHHAGSGPLSSNVSQHTRHLRCSSPPLGRRSPPKTRCRGCQGSWSPGTDRVAALELFRTCAQAARPDSASRRRTSAARTAAASSLSVGPPFGGNLSLCCALAAAGTGEPPVRGNSQALWHPGQPSAHGLQPLGAIAAPTPEVLANPSLERDLHRPGTWPARRCGPSSVARAKRHSGSGPSAQTLGLR
jgi:hypothetical protein